MNGKQVVEITRLLGEEYEKLIQESECSKCKHYHYEDNLYCSNCSRPSTNFRPSLSANEKIAIKILEKLDELKD